MRTCFLALLCAALCVAAPLPEYGYRVVHAYPHDPAAFTEGLFYLNGFLYESTGLAGKSSVRQERLETGQIVRELKLPEPYFGEGIVAWKNKLIQLTYTTGAGFVYDLANFTLLRTLNTPGEGWSLTANSENIIMDDGTPDLRFWDPVTLREIKRLRVTADNKPVENLNELEWVKGEIFANVWHSEKIARIDPVTGKVKAWIDLAGLRPPFDTQAGPDPAERVLNGIAYDAAHDRLFVTGKCWPKLFEIRLHRKPPSGE